MAAAPTPASPDPINTENCVPSSAAVYKPTSNFEAASIVEHSLPDLGDDRNEHGDGDLRRTSGLPSETRVASAMIHLSKEVNFQRPRSNGQVWEPRVFPNEIWIQIIHSILEDDSDHFDERTFELRRRFDSDPGAEGKNAKSAMMHCRDMPAETQICRSLRAELLDKPENKVRLVRLMTFSTELELELGHQSYNGQLSLQSIINRLDVGISRNIRRLHLRVEHPLLTNVDAFFVLVQFTMIFARKSILYRGRSLDDSYDPLDPDFHLGNLIERSFIGYNLTRDEELSIRQRTGSDVLTVTYTDHWSRPPPVAGREQDETDDELPPSEVLQGLQYLGERIGALDKIFEADSDRVRLCVVRACEQGFGVSPKVAQALKKWWERGVSRHPAIIEMFPGLGCV